MTIGEFAMGIGLLVILGWIACEINKQTGHLSKFFRSLSNTK